MKTALALIVLTVAAHANSNLTVTGVDVANVTRGLDPAPPGFVAVATTQGIALEGKPLVEIHNGDVDAAEKVGGASGLKINKLVNMATTLAGSRHDMAGSALLIVDQALTYRLTTEMLVSIKAAGINHFGLVAKSGGDLGVIPFVLPDKAPVAVAPGSRGPLQMVVAVTKDRILVWSLSGQEGTLQKPKATLAPTELDKLTATLADVAKRKLAGKRDRQIIFMADGDVPMKHVFEVVTAIRTAGDNTPLFPDILLSMGFE
jgi:biopolymer transport protein ExbD